MTTLLLEIYSVDLTDQPMVEDLGIPLFVEKCISVIEATGMDSLGIYRLSGNAGLIADLKEKIDQDIGKVNFANPVTYDKDVNVITGLLKTYFREMPDPLMTFHYYDSLLAAASTNSFPPAPFQSIRSHSCFSF